MWFTHRAATLALLTTVRREASVFRSWHFVPGLAGIVFVLGIGVGGMIACDDVPNCWGSYGEDVFVNRIKSQLSNPDSVKVHLVRTEEVEGQPGRYAAVAEISAQNRFGGTERLRAIGYLQDTENGCTAHIFQMG